MREAGHPAGGAARVVIWLSHPMRTTPLDITTYCPLAAQLAARVREAADELTARWLERIASRVALDRERIFPTDELLWRDIVAKNPDAVMAWFNLGDELAQQGRHEESIAAFEAGLARKPDDLHALNDLGNELVISGRPEEGVVRFQRVLSIDPDYAAAHTNLGNALDDLGRPEEALVHYLRAAELEPRLQPERICARMVS